MPQGYVQNVAETGAWARAVAAGRLPIAKGRALAGEDALRGYVIETVMCQGAVDLDAAGRRFAAPAGWQADAEPALAEMAADGLLRREGARIELTSAGRPLARVVAAVFDAYLRPAAAARHSVAV